MAKKQSAEIIFTDSATDSPKKFRKQWQKHVPDKEVKKSPSQTMPDLSMSVQEMLQRVSQGRPINSGRTPVYNGEKLLPNWKALDLIDRQRLIEQANKEVSDRKVRWQKQRAKIDGQLKEAARIKAEREAQEALKVKETPKQ